MLKSFTLTPSNDIISYKDHKEYPFILFPTLVFIYKRRHILRLDQKDLALLFYAGANSYDSRKNNYTFNFHSMSNPINILLEESDKYDMVSRPKFEQIKQLLPFSMDINTKITKYIQNEKIFWKITEKRTCRPNPITICKYTLTDETKIPIQKLKHVNKRLNLIICGEFEKHSYVPYNVNVTYVDGSNNWSIPINNRRTRLLYFVKEITRKQSITEDDEDTDDELEHLLENIHFNSCCRIML